MDKLEQNRTPRPKRQHYVPRLHLSRFVSDSPKNMIWTFDNQTARWRPSTVENAAVQSNFYTFDTADGPNDELELLLGKIESEAAAGYEMLLDGSIPMGQSRADFSTFLATLHLRTPAMVDAVAEGMADVVFRMAEFSMSAPEEYERFSEAQLNKTGKRPTISHEELLEFMGDRSRFEMAVHQKRGLGAIGAADEIAPLLFDRDWYICASPDDFFVSSDHPVQRVPPPEPVDPLRGDGGFANPDAQVTFPLSPGKMLLIGGRTGLDVDLLYLNKGQVRRLNELRVAAAARYIYSDRKSADVAELALKHRDFRPRMQFFGPGEKPNIKVVRELKAETKNSNVRSSDCDIETGGANGEK